MHIHVCAKAVSANSDNGWGQTKLAGREERAGEGHRRLAPDHLVAERQVVVLRLPQCHRHGRRRRAQPALRHVGARLVRTCPTHAWKLERAGYVHYIYI
jgi:hypothetical protein